MRPLPIALALVTFAHVAWADPEPKPEAAWRPAHSGNYSSGRRGERIQYLVLHTIEGSASGAVSWFQNRRARVSAHYIVGHDGEIIQTVRDRDNAWHAGNSLYNRRSIGIEHEGYADRNTWTRAQYEASARLARYLIQTYDIPVDREHIIAHSEVPRATHHDPGRYFDWDLYMQLLRGEEAPEVTAISPGDGQTIGCDHMANCAPGRNPNGLRVRWAADPADRDIQGFRVIVEDVTTGRHFDSDHQTGAQETFVAPVTLEHGHTYRWMVRIWDGNEPAETPWQQFTTDFTGPSVTALAPADNAFVRSAPEVSWSFDDDVPQSSFRIYLDDDADHSRIVADTRELNGARSRYILPWSLEPNRTYYWRVMGYDGHGNAGFSEWRSFTTSVDYRDLAGQDLNVANLGARVGADARALLRWGVYHPDHGGQVAFRVVIVDADNQEVFNEAYEHTTARAYRARPLPDGTYRWRVRVWDGQVAVWSDWASFTVGDTAGLTGRLNGQ